MAQSEFATWINPLLEALKELGGSARPQEVVDLVAKKCRVPDSVLDQTIIGGGSRFGNQVHWARFYLAEAGIIDRSRRGVWKLSDGAQARGILTASEIDALVAQVQGATRVGRENQALAQPARGASAQTNSSAVKNEVVELAAPTEDTRSHGERLLTLLKALPPSGFERLCQRLLREAGLSKWWLPDGAETGELMGMEFWR